MCVKTVQTLQIPILKNKIHFTPIAAWNNYDKTQIGIAFYSKKELKNIDFVFLPLFGLGSKNITGIVNFKYSFPLQKIKSLALGFQSKRFSYLVFPEDLAYNKIEPFIELNFNESKNNHLKSFGFKSNFIFLEYLYKGRQTDFYYVNHLFFKYDFNKKTDNFWFQIDAKQSTNFVLVSGEFNAKINYPTKKKNAFYARFFAGGFLYYLQSNSKNLIPSPTANFLLSANNRPYLGSTTNAFTQYQQDYNFSNLFFDRNSQDPFFKRQIGSNSDGGFKSLTSIGNSNKYLIALNLSTDIPIPVPIEPWFNMALIADNQKPAIAVEFGASLNLMNKFIQFHFPFVTTKNIAKPSFLENISFSIDLMKIDNLRKY